MTTTLIPRRVVTEVQHGHVAQAQPPWIALRSGYSPDVVLVRKDGWSLGARWCDLNAAKRLWQGEWASEIAVTQKTRYVIACDLGSGYAFLCPDGGLRLQQAEATMYPFLPAALAASRKLPAHLHPFVAQVLPG